MERHPVLHIALPLVAAALTAACGGGSEADDPASASLAMAAAPSAATAAVPRDAGARTRAGRYLGEAQAAHLERAWAESVLRVDIECCGQAAADQALGIAFGVQSAQSLPDSAPVLVRSADPRLGAATANRLAERGYPNVWLVTP